MLAFFLPERPSRQGIPPARAQSAPNTYHFLCPSGIQPITSFTTLFFARIPLSPFRSLHSAGTLASSCLHLALRQPCPRLWP